MKSPGTCEGEGTREEDQVGRISDSAQFEEGLARLLGILSQSLSRINPPSPAHYHLGAACRNVALGQMSWWSQSGSS